MVAARTMEGDRVEVTNHQATIPAGQVTEVDLVDLVDLVDTGAGIMVAEMVDGEGAHHLNSLPSTEEDGTGIDPNTLQRH